MAKERYIPKVGDKFKDHLGIVFEVLHIVPTKKPNGGDDFYITSKNKSSGGVGGSHLYLSSTFQEKNLVIPTKKMYVHSYRWKIDSTEHRLSKYPTWDVFIKNLTSYPDNYTHVGTTEVEVPVGT